MFFSTQYGFVSSNTGKVHFQGLVHFLRYIRDNKNLGLVYYSKIEDAPIYNLFRQAIIKNENQLMVFYDSSQQDYPYTGRSAGAYIVFYQGGTIDHLTHVPGPVSQYSADSEYNKSCTSGMALENFRILNNELLNKDPVVFTEQSPLVILYIKSDI